MNTRRSILTIAALFAAIVAAAPWVGAQAADRFITVASTTSTKASGLFDYMLPIFEKKTGIQVRVVAVGTGQAIAMAKRGDADVLFVHHRPSEDKFVKEGFGVKRRDVMYNDYVIVGPKADPAGIAGTKDVLKVFKTIAEKKAPFASRGDDSGTHKKELSVWKTAGIDVKKASGGWYRSTGSGMGATLNTAAGMGAYALTDRGTWIAFKNKAAMKIVSEGGADLANPYGVMLVNKAKFAHIKDKDGQAFIDWLVSKEGQGTIASFKKDGQPLFFPSAKGKDS